jgi:hypothetical protein
MGYTVTFQSAISTSTAIAAGGGFNAGALNLRLCVAAMGNRRHLASTTQTGG